MTRNSASRFSSETGFFHSHSRKARLCHSGCLSDSDVFFTLHYSSGKSLCQHLMHLIPISPPPTARLLNNFPCEILFPSRSVCLSFSLSLSLVVGCLHLSWQLCASSPAIWNDSSHPGATARAVYWERATHTHSLEQILPQPHPPCVYIYMHTLSHSITHTPPPPPPRPGLNSEMRLL